MGCALIANEKEESILWVLQTWLKCTLGKHPQPIITDQDLAMGKAIAKAFPNSSHRFCSWHIGRNSMKYLVDLKSKEGLLGTITTGYTIVHRLKHLRVEGMNFKQHTTLMINIG